ncbi:MAG: flagellar protein FlbB [Alphaproteobacteria bacterium]|nr:flagellar protein FlbB [Alphaproteobacteria bacterium]
MSAARNFRVLPVLVFAIALAFSLKLADVAGRVSTLFDSAYAEEKAALPPPEEAAVHGAEGKDAGDAHLAEGEAVDEAAQGADTDEGAQATEWRDAADTDLELSDVKMEMLDDLSARRKELEAFEASLRTREALLQAAEQEIDRKYQELSKLRGEIKDLLGQQAKEEDERINSLVKIYEGMKPKDAARIFDTLDLDILVTVMSRMSERKLSPVLASMNPERARTVTIMLAEQKALPSLPEME